MTKTANADQTATPNAKAVNGKLLVIRKPDKTVHKVSPNNEAALRALSNKLPASQKWSFELMDEAEAMKLPFIDKDFVSAGEAQLKAKDLQKQNTEQANRIAELEALLAGKGTGGKEVKMDTGNNGSSENGGSKEPVDYAAKTVKELKDILTERSITFANSDAKATLVDLLEKADTAAAEEALLK